MKRLFRPKILLFVALCFLFVFAPAASAQQASQSADTPRIVKGWEDLTSEDIQSLTPQEYELVKSALMLRDPNNFWNLNAPAKAEQALAVLDQFTAQLWPQKDPQTGIESPGILGYPAHLLDGLIDSQPTVSPRTMLASLSPKLRQTLAQGEVCEDDPDVQRFDIRTPFWQMPLGTKVLLDLSPVSTFWTGFRNLAYAALTIVLVVFGFMIMLRKSIEPRVTMMISNALPRIATALVLITFSFAISGLIIDVGRVVDAALKSTFRGVEGFEQKNYNIYSLLYEFGRMGLLEPFKPLRKTSYVFRFSEDWKDREHPEWRCDYNPGCRTQDGSQAFNCNDAKNNPCPDYYCSLGPIKVWSCAICLAKEPSIKIDFDLGPWPIHFEKKIADYWCIIMKDGVNNPFNYDDDAVGGEEGGPPRGCTFGYQEDLGPGGTGERLMFGEPRGVACCNRKGPPQYRAIQCPYCDPQSLRNCTCDQTSAFPDPFPRDTWNKIEYYANVVIISLISLLINLLFFLTLLQTVFALLFKLINCFAMWFILAIVSPLVFMWGTIPGQEGTISSWAKHFLANVLAFPVVNFVIALASVIAEVILDADPNTAVTAFPSLMAIGGTKRQILLLIPYGMILLTPQIPDIISGIIGAKAVGGKGGPDMTKQAKKLPLIGGLVG